jgi:hypothetical protein
MAFVELTHLHKTKTSPRRNVQMFAQQLQQAFSMAYRLLGVDKTSLEAEAYQSYYRVDPETAGFIPMSTTKECFVS